MNIRLENTMSEQMTAVGNNRQASVDRLDKRAREPGPAVYEAAAESSTGSFSEQEKLQALVEEINTHLDLQNQGIAFQFDDDVRKMTVNVVDRKTGSVIRKIPPDYLLKLAVAFKSAGKLEGGLLTEQA